MRTTRFRHTRALTALALAMAEPGFAAPPATTDVNRLDEWFSPEAASKKSVTAKPESPEPGASANQHPVDAFELPEVAVVSTTPLGSTGLELKKISGNVQSAEDEDVQRHGALALPDFLNRRMESVNVNDTQNNPYQPDITYRGFNASPLLGTPIGISVYQDGVRVNEAFGDTVNWDLIPQVAIASMEMIPGSNPLFGLNTLGGALSVRTKSGFSHPGFHAQSYGGSYGRQAYQAELGGSKDNLDWYFAGNIFGDDGWRPFSPSSVNQGFGKIGWENEKTDLDLSFTFADNHLQGVGPTPQAMLQQNWSAIFSAPDSTKNTMYFVNLKGSHRFTDELQLSGNSYFRKNNNNSLNSNTGGNCDVWVPETLSCQNGASPGAFQATQTRTNGMGANLQLTSDYKIQEHDNQFVVGGGFNYGHTQFYEASQDAMFNANLYEIGTSPFAPQAQLVAQNAYSNLFATDTFSVFDWMHINSAVNWIQAQVQNADQINPASSIYSLSANNHYQRLNPSAGITINPFDALALQTPMQEFTTYFNYNEGFRAPTAVEMGCSNPSVPCNLPNSMISDPPTLKPVVSHTLEAGMRGKFSKALKWNFAAYQTINSNDILFESVNYTGTRGYFANVGNTRRQGVEFGLSGLALESLNWYLSYGFVDATYQSAAQLFNGLGEERVVPGNKIPSIPQNTLKFGAEYEFFRNLFLGSDVQYSGGQFARGDDQNVYQQLSDYTVVNLNGRYIVNRYLELFAMGRNILDNHYLSFGQMGQNFYTGQNAQFVGPGAVATGFAGIRLHWD